MRKSLGTALLFIVSVALAENIALENADCTKMKTYKLRTACLEAQGKTEAQSAREHGVQDNSPRLLDSAVEEDRSKPSRPTIVPRKNIKDGDMNIFKAQAVIESSHKEIADCRSSYDVYWKSDPEKVRPCLREMLSIVAPGSDLDAARKFVTYPEYVKKISQTELAMIAFNMKEMAKHVEYLTYSFKSKNEEIFP